jgi:hypothetical protein
MDYVPSLLALGLAGAAAKPAVPSPSLPVARRKVSGKFPNKFLDPSFYYLNFLNDLFYLNYNLNLKFKTTLQK